MSSSDKDKGERAESNKRNDVPTPPDVHVPRGELDKPHRFWDSQPVPKVSEAPSLTCGPIEPPKTVDQVRQEPYNLPEKFEWTVIDLMNDLQLEEVHALLRDHYVEDDDACFRFLYGKDCLRWAMMPPGSQEKDWRLGLKANGHLLAFISAIPVTMRIHSDSVPAAIVNFLCVHKSLRSKRLAPVLIKEVTRRVNLAGIWQAVYTIGSFLPKPVSECQYFHRPLKIQKLVEIGFSRLHGRTTMRVAKKLYELPSEHLKVGVRVMEEKDIGRVCQLLAEFQKRQELKLCPIMSKEDVAHWLLPRKEVVFTYVIEDPVTGEVTDFFSFYHLPSNVIRYNEVHNELRAAYNFYSAANTIKSEELIHEALIAAKRENFDVYNVLDLCDNHQSLTDPKFGQGDGTLRYYLYNWKCPPVECKGVGLILL